MKMFLGEVILVTAVAILKNVITLESKVTNPELNALNVTFKQVSLTTTSESPFPILVTTLSPEALQFKNRRRGAGVTYKYGRSTSSSSNERVPGKVKGKTEERLSLALSSLSEIPSVSTGDGITKPGEVKSSAERRGWRKWHRKCQGCPELKTRWREPTINWICGAYQRARRTFKSECVMHFRNCQDGTMFVKILDHRCPDDQINDTLPHGDHFFYEYRVQLTGESTRESKGNSRTDSNSKTVETFSLSGGSHRSSEARKKMKRINYRRREKKHDSNITNKKVKSLK